MKENYKVIGLMSGTSLDGLDLAYCSFRFENGKWTFTLEASKNISYGKQLFHKLQGAPSLPGLDLLLLDSEYGKWLGSKVRQFVRKQGLKVDFVASHGHTVFHQPNKGLTFQLGNGQEIANSCGMKTICNFREKDVRLGGQGAPLVPIGDQLLFPQYNYCLNLGGISNISFESGGHRRAYDIGIANMALNHLALQLGLLFDEDGGIAKKGILNEPLFQELNALPYYQKPFPKSTGFEWFHEEVLPILNLHDISVSDRMSTVTHHIAHSIAQEVNRLDIHNSRLLVTGGGAKNKFLVELLRSYLNESVAVVIPEQSIVDFKEAIVFALMGVLRYRNEVNCLRSVTGARIDNCGGDIYWPG